MNNKKLLLKLIKAYDEKEVESIISSHPILSKDSNWKPYGGFRGNFSQIHNQQCNAIPALVEKPINSIDALLIKECKLRGLDPEGSEAPNSIQDAVENFYGIKRGDFSEISRSKRREIAKNIQLITEGSKQNPNIIIYDDGEGQHPEDFENTFVSLTKDNKMKIKFVQGKYNMGGTGALPNCGDNKYQLILSRKDSKLLSGKKDLYGFTLVRLHKVTSVDQYKHSWYEFCVDGDGNIFSFYAKELDLGLYKRHFISGTYIKLFNYDLPDPSHIGWGLWRALNRYLYFPALPILLYEKREYRGHADTKLMLGNRMRVMIDDREMKETTFPMSINFKDVKCPVEITIFKDNVAKREFIDKLAVIFTVNGQVHDHLTNAFITEKAKLPYLSGHLLVNIDCTNIPVATRELNLFMASRDRTRDSAVARTLKEEIAKELRDNDRLRQLNDKRRDEKIFQNPKDEEFLKKVMSKLLRKNEEISKLLGLNGTMVSNITRTVKKKIKKEGDIFKSKRFPTFLKLKKVTPGNIKMLPQNGETKLLLETDVEDEYLIRPQDRGEMKITFEKPHLGIGGEGAEEGVDEEIFDVNVVGPSQGQIKLRIKTKRKLPVGTSVPINIELSSPEGPYILTAFIKIANPAEKAKEKEVKTPITYSLPKIIQVYKEKKQEIECAVWDDPYYSWNGEDICKIFPSGNERYTVDAVAINMDASVVHNYIRRRKLTDKNIEHLKRLFLVGNYLVSLILYFQLSHREDIEDKEELLSYLMKGVGKIILQVIINEEIIKEAEKE